MSEEPKFKVGDKVAVYGYGGWGLAPQRWDEISKVTPTGRIRVKGYPRAIYGPDGGERTSSYSGTYLKHDTPELRREIADDEEEKELRRFPINYPWRSLSLPQLRELKALLDTFTEPPDA
jgi:hypothetical protein